MTTPPYACGIPWCIAIPELPTDQYCRVHKQDPQYEPSNLSTAEPQDEDEDEDAPTIPEDGPW